MHFDSPPAASSTPHAGPWYKELTRYHWFVLVVAALGWLFDTMDQQLFNLARVPAMKALVTTPEDEPSVARAAISNYAGYATSIFLIGWATGGLAFGVLGDRIGRAKTMLLTILLYSIFTGLSALSQNFFEFAVYRFLTGLGVGGEFAVGVSLVAEVMPDRARPHALGLLQALSAVGNIAAAVISIVLGSLEESGAIGEAWKLMFVVGTVPALLCLLIFRHLKEPERWQALKKAAREGTGKQLGSLAELFGDPRWRKRAIIGLLLSSSGIIGLWAIGFFSFDLTRSVFRKNFEAEAREQGEAQADLQFVRVVLQKLEAKTADPALEQALKKVQAADLLNLQANNSDVQILFKAIVSLHRDNKDITTSAVRGEVGRLLEKEAVAQLGEERSSTTAEVQKRSQTWHHIGDLLSGPVQTNQDIAVHVERITKRTPQIAGRLTLWAGITSVMLNLGAALGIYAFTYITQFSGRKPAFAVSFVLALLSTAGVFWFLDTLTDVFWMMPIMGFCQLALFGGYAIYFPELFPTRLRSTGISFCYNVARYVAATGPLTLGFLSSQVFTERAGFEEPLRYAGVAMCSVFLIGLCALPFAPETKGQPLPE
jgi:MFS family permease